MADQQFQLKDGRYHIAIWVIDWIKLGNVMIVVFRDSPTDDWTCLMRIRSYVDDKVFGSADKKSWYKSTFPASMEESVLEALMDTHIEKITGIMGEKNDLPYDCLHKLDIHSDDPAVAAALMRSSPHFHAAPCDPDTGELLTDTYKTEDDCWDSMTR